MDEAGTDEAGTGETGDDEEAEVDPYAEFRKELKYALGKWYVIHSYAGFEKRVKQNIENRKVSMTMEDYIFQVEVPMEDVVEIKNGQRKLVNRVRIPGYVLVRNGPQRGQLVGRAPHPRCHRIRGQLPQPDTAALRGGLQHAEEPRADRGGPGLQGGRRERARRPRASSPQRSTSRSARPSRSRRVRSRACRDRSPRSSPRAAKLTVLVSLFERETPVELSFEQVTKL